MPFGGAGSRRERAERVRGLLDAQLRFAVSLSQLRGEPLERGVATYTNFHRRFGYGTAPAAPSAPGWLAFVDELCAARDDDARLACALRHFELGGEEQPMPGHRIFGCFSYTPPEDDGGVRIHFIDRDPADGPGPLSSTRTAQRRTELQEMVRDVRAMHPSARTIHGRSWLYHRPAYRRLFPDSYLATSEPVARVDRYAGSSLWGQFQTHTGIDAAACARFVDGLGALEADAPWRVFPLLPLTVSAPIEAFVG